MILIRHIAIVYLLLAFFIYDVCYSRNPASGYLPLHHWSYEYIERLRLRGRMPSLNASVRPYTRMAVAQSLLSAESEENLTSIELHWIQLLKTEFAQEIGWMQSHQNPAMIHGQIHLSDRTYTNRGRVRNDYRADPETGIQMPHFTSVLRGRIDRGLLHDASYIGRRTSFAGARIEDGYGRFEYGAVSLVFGRFSEEWSPVVGRSLILSANPYSYDKAGLIVSSRLIQFRSLFSMLEDMNSARRFFSAHRLDIRFRNGIQLGLTESVIYGGVHQIPDISYINPFSIFAEVQLNQKKEANENLAFDFYVPYQKYQFAGQILIDDFILDGPGKPPPNRQTSPDRLGMIFRFSANDPFFANSQLIATYERIGSYTYNVKQKRPWQSYTFQNRGLGAPANDGDMLSFQINYFLLSHWNFGLETYFERRGERTLLSHDFEDSTFVKLPFPSGKIENTFGVLLLTDYHIRNQWFFKLRSGVEWVKNERHQRRNRTFFYFDFSLDYQFRFHYSFAQ